MPTTQAFAQKLYLDSAELAYTESQMAISPKPPFGVSDSAALNDQAEAMAYAAKRLRTLNPGAISQTSATDASYLVHAAQTLLDSINNVGVANTYSADTVLEAGRDTITSLNAL